MLYADQAKTGGGRARDAAAQRDGEAEHPHGRGVLRQDGLAGDDGDALVAHADDLDSNARSGWYTKAMK